MVTHSHNNNNNNSNSNTHVQQAQQHRACTRSIPALKHRCNTTAANTANNANNAMPTSRRQLHSHPSTPQHSLRQTLTMTAMTRTSHSAGDLPPRTAPQAETDAQVALTNNHRSHRCSSQQCLCLSCYRRQAAKARHVSFGLRMALPPSTPHRHQHTRATHTTTRDTVIEIRRRSTASQTKA